jgi:hypothetical protein
MCHPQGARLYLLGYMPIWVLVDKTLCSVWLCVYYVAVWCVSILYTFNNETEIYDNHEIHYIFLSLPIHDMLRRHPVTAKLFEP